MRLIDRPPHLQILLHFSSHNVVRYTNLLNCRWRRSIEVLSLFRAFLSRYSAAMVAAGVVPLLAALLVPNADVGRPLGSAVQIDAILILANLSLVASKSSFLLIPSRTLIVCGRSLPFEGRLPASSSSFRWILVLRLR